MMVLWSLAGLPLGVYNICSNFNIALQVQPQILMFLSLITWSQCKYYGDQWRVLRIVLVLSALALLLGGVEAALIIGLRKARDGGVKWPLTFMAILSAVLLAAGVMRHYGDIYRTRSVRGLSLTFVGIDALGDLTSLLSLLFEPSIDILGLVIYGSELVLWIGIMICVVVFNLILRKRDPIQEETDTSIENVQQPEGPTV